MKDYKRLTEKKEITECEIVSDKRYSVGFKQIPHKINRNIIRGVHTICNDMDGQGDYIIGDIVDKIADLEDKIESGEIDYVADSKTEQTITDLLIEFDEMGFTPTTVCPNAEQYAIDWRDRVRKEFARLTKERDSKEEAYNKCYFDYKNWKDKANEYKHRADVAERALCYAVSEYRCDECPCLDCNAEIRGSQECIDCVCAEYIKEAEKDIAEEGEE